jgi:hypothetical protein
MPPAKKTTAAALLDLLISKAPALHAAGITSLTLDGVAVTLTAPPAPPPPPRAKGKADEDPPPLAQGYADPLNDPSTYPGGRLPGFTRVREEE